MEISHNSSRAEPFPSGLRVLVVDDDPTWLKILEKMLKKCSYEVTTCWLAREALKLLREKRDRFDIVISDVNMPDMDGFKLLELVGLEMDLPVIMMSVDGETSRVMKGVQHGACDYLLKPIRMKELKNIWQHVYRKKKEEVKVVESDGLEEFQLIRNRLNEPDDRLLFSGSDFNFSKKRKDHNNKELVDQDFMDPSSVKKNRVVWSVELHQKFVNAVNEIGFNKVGPKKILDLMNVPGLTRENVASHLQKYRQYLIRLQKENEDTTCEVVMHPDSAYKDSNGSTCFQSSTTSLSNHSSNVRAYSSDRTHVSAFISELGSNSNDRALKEIDRKNVTHYQWIESSESKTAHQIDVLSSPKKITGSSIDNTTYECSIPNLLPSNGSPQTQIMHCRTQEQDPFSLLAGYPCKQQQEAKGLLDDPIPTTSPLITTGWNGSSASKSTNIIHGENLLTNMPVYQMNSVVDQINHGTCSNFVNLGAKSENRRFSTVKSHYPDQFLIDLVECSSQTSNITEELTMPSSPDNAYYSFGSNFWFDKTNKDSFEFLHDDVIVPTDLSGDLNDGLQFDCEYVLDIMEHPTMDGSLFA